MPYKPAVLTATEPSSSSKFVYRFGGNSCLAGDYIGMGDFAFDEPLEIGDRIVFDDMIHYTMVKTTFFNGVKHPSIGMVTKDGDFILLAEPGNYADYKAKLG
jgi:carboxynorspermidine decarboxylase